MSTDLEEFKRGAVRPMECVRGGWQLIREQYWLFLGICFVGVLIGSMVPLGILWGPMLCGIYICLMRQGQGRPVAFDMLFKGFDYFMPGMIASLLMFIPMIVLMIPLYILLMVTMVSMGPRGDPGPFFAMLGLFYLAIIVLSLVIHCLFFFAFPLIVDRRLSGLDAVKLSMRAALANIGGILGLVLLQFLMSMVGVCACYIGAIFVLPLVWASSEIAYQQVFTRYDDREDDHPRRSRRELPPYPDDDEDLDESFRPA